MTALAVGMARADGLIGLDTRLLDVFPRYAGDAADGVGDITVERLLTMTSGSSFTCFTDAEWLRQDVLGAFVAAPLRTAPGERFEYSNGSTYALGRMVTAVTGTSLVGYLRPRLFEPLGILNPQWFACRAGYAWAASGLHLRSGELARFGPLLLERGRHDGEQLVPADWIDRLHADWVPTGDDEPESTGYGFQVWRCTVPNAWRADGAYGQFVIVLPDQGATVTLTAHHEGGGAEILRAVWDELLPLL